MSNFRAANVSLTRESVFEEVFYFEVSPIMTLQSVTHYAM